MVASSKLVAPQSKKVKKGTLLVPVANAKVMVKGSVWKINRVLDVIRGMNLFEATNALMVLPYAAVEPVAKLIKSAAANAFQGGMIQNISQLIISEIYSTKAMELKRMKAASRGRPSPRRKAYSTVNITLAIQPQD